jgi:hypothetical protein
METTCILIIVSSTDSPRKKRPQPSKKTKTAKTPVAKKLPQQLPLPFTDLLLSDKPPP